MKKLLIGLFALSLLATACKKDKAVPITKENIAGSYKVTAAVYKETGMAEEDSYLDWPACEKDDIEKFILDGAYQHIDAGSVCDPAQDSESTWTLVGETLTIGEQSYAVSKFDGSTMELTLSEVDGDITMTMKVTLQKQ